jgi:hypothetical protein
VFVNRILRKLERGICAVGVGGKRGGEGGYQLAGLKNVNTNVKQKIKMRCKK